MIEVSNMLMVGALSRNIGKTEFVCALIRKLSKTHNVCDIIVTTVHENDYDFHGDVPDADLYLQGKRSFEIKEEPLGNADCEGTDTAKMLYYGAKKALWVCSSFKDLAAVAKEVVSTTKSFEYIVCESNSLRHHIRPKQFILLEKTGLVSAKPEAEVIRTYADIILNQFDEATVDRIVSNIEK